MTRPEVLAIREEQQKQAADDLARLLRLMDLGDALDERSA